MCGFCIPKTLIWLYGGQKNLEKPNNLVALSPLTKIALSIDIWTTNKLNNIQFNKKKYESY